MVRISAGWRPQSNLQLDVGGGRARSQTCSSRLKGRGPRSLMTTQGAIVFPVVTRGRMDSSFASSRLEGVRPSNCPSGCRSSQGAPAKGPGRFWMADGGDSRSDGATLASEKRACNCTAAGRPEPGPRSARGGTVHGGCGRPEPAVRANRAAVGEGSAVQTSGRRAPAKEGPRLPRHPQRRRRVRWTLPMVRRALQQVLLRRVGVCPLCRRPVDERSLPQGTSRG
jgi:hypothetical protein